MWEPASNGRNIYCALCGAILCRPLWLPENREDLGPFGLHAFAEVGWLLKVRVIGEAHPHVAKRNNAWVSGPALLSIARNRLIRPNEPGQGMDPALEGVSISRISIYEWHARTRQRSTKYDVPWCVPFHVSCRELFCRYLGIPVPHLDKAIFLMVFKKFAREEPRSLHLELPYGDIAKLMKPRWRADCGDEHLFSNPIRTRLFRGVLRDMLPHAVPEIKNLNTYDVTGDPFIILSNEMLLWISKELPVSSLYELRKASPAFASLELSNGYWMSRLQKDMPWLWELQTYKVDDLNWENAYARFWWASLASSQSKIDGLCNRRRIWSQLCPIFAKVYNEYQGRLECLGYVDPPSFNLAISLGPWHVAFEKSPYWRRTQPLLDHLDDLSNTNLSLRLVWTADGYLAEIDVLQNDRLYDTAQRRLPAHYTSQTVQIPTDDWPRGFVVTTREAPTMISPRQRQVVGLEIYLLKHSPIKLGSTDGDKRLIHVPSSSFLVGLKTYQSSSGTLSRLGFLTRAKTQSYERLRAAKNDAYSDLVPFKDYLWREKFPQAGVKVRPVWPSKREGIKFKGQDAGDTLMFGISEEELADVTGISVDVHLGGFEITYGHRPSRIIGPHRLAMKTLTIDGKGGERIVGMNVAEHESRLTELWLATNRGRVLIIGRHRSPINYGAGALPYCGIRVTWRCNRRSHHLESIDGLLFPPLESSSRTHYNYESFFSRSPRSTSNAMMPTPTFASIGMAWGLQKTFEPSITRSIEYLDFHQNPSKYARGTWIEYDGSLFDTGTSCWLDCSSKISEVHISMVENSGTRNRGRAPIAAISFRYTDGNTTTVGPNKFPMDSRCKWCQAEVGNEAKTNSCTQYHHLTWQVGDQKLAMLRIWESRRLGIAAMQMIAENKVESPIWGYEGFQAKTKKASELHFTSYKGGEATGVKLFSGDEFDIVVNEGKNSGLQARNLRKTKGVTRSETLIIGIQGIKVATRT